MTKGAAETKRHERAQKIASTITSLGFGWTARGIMRGDRTENAIACKGVMILPGEDHRSHAGLRWTTPLRGHTLVPSN